MPFLLIACFLMVSPSALVAQQDDCSEQVEAHVREDAGHPWRPPFGLERIGRPFTAVVEISSKRGPLREYSLVAYRDGKEVDRQLLHLGFNDPYYTDTVSFEKYPTEVALFAKCTFRGEPVELLRRKIDVPAIEADAAAYPDHVTNPVDLGTVLFPADWLLLAKGQRAIVEVAAISHAHDITGDRAAAWFESTPGEKETANITAEREGRADVKLIFPPTPAAVKDDILHITITDSQGNELWHKQIKTMLVSDPPHWPRFGATYTKLRYDAPISVRDPITGLMSSMNYEDAWRSDLKDVVVSFPNGARFVFWRGSSYVPFWASLHNTGFTYEWAETSPPPEGFNDSVEPLMDKELRYGRVEILESTSARVHVRWTYQSCDFTYKVWGDSTAEDFYFYPDGFGTRVLNLKGAMGWDYELSEFIVLTPAAAYPLQVIPHTPVDLLFIDGMKREVSFPFFVEGITKKFTWPDYLLDKVHGMPVVYRVRINKDDPETVIYFNPLDTNLPPYPFAPFYDRGNEVTPAYWGRHWPLARGKTTGGSIDDRIYLSPSHNSLMSWGGARPKPNSTASNEDVDTLGRSKPMALNTWVWLIGMTGADDVRVVQWAHSFMSPPSVQLKGARLDFESYEPARRAIRLLVDAPEIIVTLKPTVVCIDPVLELRMQQGDLLSVTLGTRRLNANEYAWDGHTPWLNADINRAEELHIEFGNK
jgi:hypothetical protein